MLIPKRLLFTGYNTSHVTRHASYALEMGATIYHIGYSTLFPAKEPAGYHFIRSEPETNATMRLMGFKADQYAEIVAPGAKQVAAVAAEVKPDLCHAVGMDLTFHYAVHAGIRPLLVSAHGFLESLVYKEPVIKWANEALFQADALIVEPPMMVGLMRSLLPPSVQVHEFAIGLDGRHFRPYDAAARAKLRRAMQFPPGAKVILSARGLGTSYNQDLILDAFAQALPSLPPDSYLVLVQMGRSGDAEKSERYLAARQEQAAALGIADQVRWLPTFPEMTLPTLYNAADFAISYRTPDTFGNTVLELMACGCPVIVPALPTYPGSIIAEHAHMIPPKDVGALAQAIIDLAHRPPTVEALAAARQAILARYDKPVVMQQIAAIYNSLVAA